MTASTTAPEHQVAAREHAEHQVEEEELSKHVREKDEHCLVAGRHEDDEADQSPPKRRDGKSPDETVFPAESYDAPYRQREGVDALVPVLVNVLLMRARIRHAE